MHRYALASASLVVIAFAMPAMANEDVLQQSAKPEQWVLQTGDYANQRYSKLDQINRDNVKNLKVAWTFSTGVLRGHEGSPLVVGNIMYVHTPFPNIVYALDLNEDGKILWKYEPKQDPSVIPVMCCDTVYRGLAYADGTHLPPPGRHHAGRARCQDRQGEVEGRQRRPEEGRDQYGDRAAGEGQGHRRHFRRRVRRARSRHRLRRQDRQAGVACLLARPGQRNRCSIRTRPCRSASRSARTRRSRPGTASSGRSAAARPGAGSRMTPRPTCSSTARPIPRPGTRCSAPGRTASRSTRSGRWPSLLATSTPAWRDGPIR